MSSYLINIGFRQNIEEEKYMSQSEKTVGFCKWFRIEWEEITAMLKKNEKELSRMKLVESKE